MKKGINSLQRLYTWYSNAFLALILLGETTRGTGVIISEILAL